MAAPEGTKQKTYYVREDLAKVMAHIASRDDVNESDIVNTAFQHYVESKLTTVEMKVFGYKKENNNGHANGTSSTSPGRRNGHTNGERGVPPGAKK